MVHREETLVPELDSLRSLDFGSTGVQAKLERQPAEVSVGCVQDAAWPCLVLSTEPDGSGFFHLENGI